MTLTYIENILMIDKILYFLKIADKLNTLFYNNFFNIFYDKISFDKLRQR